MEREKFLKSVKDNLEAAGFSVDDLVQFCAEEEAKKKKSEVVDSAKEFPFEVMYEGLVRSWVPLEGKKPLGVIFENHLITLKSSPEAMNWEDATDYCRKFKVEDYTCSAGEIKFWKKLLGVSLWKKKELDDLFVSLGGEVLIGRKFWASSEYSRDHARQWCYACDALDYYYDDKDYDYGNLGYVRPVLDLSDLSC